MISQNSKIQMKNMDTSITKGEEVRKRFKASKDTPSHPNTVLASSILSICKRYYNFQIR